MAPEYATRGQLTDKADVYSFGVLMFEVISGRKNIDFTAAPPERVYLLEWVSDNQEHGSRIPFQYVPVPLLDYPKCLLSRWVATSSSRRLNIC